MAWTKIDDGRKNVVVGGETNDDGALTDVTACLVDDTLDVSCIEIKYDSMTPSWEGIRFEIDVDPSTIDTGSTMSIRYYCQEAMDAGKLTIAPYTDSNTIDNSNAVLGPETAAAGWFEIDLTANFVADLADLGDVFAIRLYSTTAEAAKIKTSELEYELSFGSSSSSSDSSSSSSSESSSSSSSGSSSSSSKSSSSSSSESSSSSSSESSSSSSESSSSSSESSSSSSSESSSSSSESSSSSSESSSSSSCGLDPNKDYTRGDYNVLPADDTNLEIAFACPEYEDVEVDDDIYVTQTATDEYGIFLWKVKNDNSDDLISITWKGKSDIAPSDSTMYLQIYNYDSTTWETKDIDDATGAGTEFILTADIPDPAEDYYDASNWVSWRVYQEAA